MYTLFVMELTSDDPIVEIGQLRYERAAQIGVIPTILSISQELFDQICASERIQITAQYRAEVNEPVTPEVLSQILDMKVIVA